MDWNNFGRILRSVELMLVKWASLFTTETWFLGIWVPLYVLINWAFSVISWVTGLKRNQRITSRVLFDQFSKKMYSYR